MGNIVDEILVALGFRIIDVNLKTKSDIGMILDDPETDMSKATDICDYLGIERRSNRSRIVEIIGRK
ncbi:MAG: hypothetical protein ACYDEX_19175 [Mobilitalea sp.]